MKQTAVEWVFNQMSNAATGYVTELNYQEILDKAKELESKMKESQEKIKNIQAEGTSGSNSIKVTLEINNKLKGTYNNVTALKHTVQCTRTFLSHVYVIETFIYNRLYDICV